MSIPTRLGPKLRPLLSSATNARSFASKTTTEEWPQRTPLGSYYETILHQPTQYRRPETSKTPANTETPAPRKRQPKPKPEDTSKKATSTSSSSSPPPAETRPAPGEQTPEERMRAIFGSRVLTPEEMAKRMATKKSQSTSIAGVLVPPKPEEPDNCCMSGCVNCVWERFREDMEEWTLRSTEAQRALAEQSSSMDSDGGGSESNWVGDTKIAKDLWAKDVFESVPLGIREFMKQEKRLKERHQREGTVGN